jgi:hypothetical protein
LLNNFNKPKTPQPIQNHSILPTTNVNTYDLTKIINKKKKSKPITTIPELQSYIKAFKSMIQTFKQAQQKDSSHITKPPQKVRKSFRF